jgi:hypothetical protein
MFALRAMVKMSFMLSRCNCHQTKNQKTRQKQINNQVEFENKLHKGQECK